jgi:hypothetical protein
MAISNLLVEVRYNVQVYRREEEHHCGPSFPIAERSTYKHDLPYLQETDTHLAAIQLRRGKTLLDKPAIKKRATKPVPETLPEREQAKEEHDNVPKLTTFSLPSYQQAILDGYKTDVQFSKALIAGVDSGVYRKDSKGLLYTGPDEIDYAFRTSK